MCDQITPDEMPKTLLQAVRYFADLDVCDRYMRSIKWPDGKIVADACAGDDGPNTYEWDTGIAP